VRVKTERFQQFPTKLRLLTGQTQFEVSGELRVADSGRREDGEQAACCNAISSAALSLSSKRKRQRAQQQVQTALLDDLRPTSTHGFSSLQSGRIKRPDDGGDGEGGGEATEWTATDHSTHTHLARTLRP